jgi:hypothetical protein
MPVKMRVTASQGAPGRGPVPALIYRAEAYDDEDRFRDAVWKCPHDHDTVEAAVNCGQSWLTGGVERLSESA